MLTYRKPPLNLNIGQSHPLAIKKELSVLIPKIPWKFITLSEETPHMVYIKSTPFIFKGKKIRAYATVRTDKCTRIQFL